MKISGKEIAQELRAELKKKIDELKTRGVTPKIAIITLGAEDSWQTYVAQKVKVADELGIKAVVLNLEDADQEKLLKVIEEINLDPAYHGIIVQRPMPAMIDRTTIVNSISNDKDVDGFREDSKFEVPVWLAVGKLLSYALKELNKNSDLGSYSITVLGKGETAGGPIRRALLSLNAHVKLVDSKTADPDQIIRNSDIVISCVGKSGVVNSLNLKPGAILIGVGTHGEDGKLRGDYDQNEIEQIAAAFTPTPGGVGPVNLTYLFSNLVQAANGT